MQSHVSWCYSLAWTSTSLMRKDGMYSVPCWRRWSSPSDSARFVLFLCTVCSVYFFSCLDSVLLDYVKSSRPFYFVHVLNPSQIRFSVHVLTSVALGYVRAFQQSEFYFLLCAWTSCASFSVNVGQRLKRLPPLFDRNPCTFCSSEIFHWLWLLPPAPQWPHHFRISSLAFLLNIGCGLLCCSRSFHSNSALLWSWSLY